MNPGSSQFASQFPDAEETMSNMESKKLPIFDALVFPGRLVDCVRASDHGRIVHEQREVIRKLVEALEWEIEKTALNTHEVAAGALAAAAPYLRED